MSIVEKSQCTVLRVRCIVIWSVLAVSACCALCMHAVSRVAASPRSRRGELESGEVEGLNARAVSASCRQSIIRALPPPLGMESGSFFSLPPPTRMNEEERGSSSMSPRRSRITLTSHASILHVNYFRKTDLDGRINVCVLRYEYFFCFVNSFNCNYMDLNE